MSDCLKAAIYCRISLDKELGKANEREGVERQERECREICRFQGYEVYDVYPDDSISAHGTATKKSKERPEYKRMIQDFLDGNFDVIVGSKFDRISRSNEETNQLLKDAKCKHLLICTGDLGEQSLTEASSKFLLQISSAVSEFESSRKSERYKALYYDRAHRGIFRSGPNRSYGYTNHNEIIPEEAEIVKLIYTTFDKGSTANAITRALRGEDDGTLPNFPIAVPTRVADAIAKGETPPDLKWSERSTRNILRNPKYAGYVYHAPTKEDGSHQSYASNWREWIVRDDSGDIVRAVNVEPVIDEDLWWRVQDRLDENLTDDNGNLIRRNTGRKSIGSGLYLCGVCGKPLTTGGRANFKGHDYGMTLYCKGHMSRMAKPVDNFVIGAIKKRLAQPALKDLLFEPEDHSSRLSEIRDEIKVIRGRIAQTEHDYDDDLIDAKTRKRKIGKLEERINELQDERTSLSTDDLTASIINAPDPVAAFEKLTDPRQIGQVIDMLCTVTVYPHQRGKRITAESLKKEVKIKWKTA